MKHMLNKYYLMINKWESGRIKIHDRHRCFYVDLLPFFSQEIPSLSVLSAKSLCNRSVRSVDALIHNNVFIVPIGSLQAIFIPIL